MSNQRIAVFGSTGSIGTQTLEVLEAEGEEFSPSVLVAHSSLDLLVEQVKKFHPSYVGVVNADLVGELKERLRGIRAEVVGGDAVFELANEADLSVNAVSGFAGLGVTIATLRAGSKLALANKESLIAAGDLVTSLVGLGGSQIIPVDSEHSAIFQCLWGNNSPSSVRKLIITASGGPFRTHSNESLEVVTVDEALAHPTWSMGPKITVDSSTLVNKGLEVIEAHYLFGVAYDDIEVVVHPQSIVHSMVEFCDGSTMAQISEPDMRLPISVALRYPERGHVAYGRIPWSKGGINLQFDAVDEMKFPGLRIAYEAGKMGGGAPCWFNASNEVAVAHFLSGGIRWKEIGELLERSMDRYPERKLTSIEEVVSTDSEARECVLSLIGKV